MNGREAREMASGRCDDCGEGLELDPRTHAILCSVCDLGDHGEAECLSETCPDCGMVNQRDQFCRWCAQHFGPNTNRPYTVESSDGDQMAVIASMAFLAVVAIVLLAYVAGVL